VPWLILVIVLIAFLVVPVQAALNPDFTGTPRSGVTPLTVQFNDTSTGLHDQWQWEFGDGGTSTEQKPLYTYNKPGSYNVKIVIRNASEEQATLVQDNYITVEQLLIPVPLNPDFTGTPRSGVTPLTVQFNDTSTGLHDQWEWEFGDGNKSIEQKPLYTYYKPGSYNVKLIITNTSGEQATITQKDYITVEPALIPVPLNPDFTGTPRSGVTPLTVQFNDTSTGPHDQWEWEFGDGNKSIEQKPLCTYYKSGSYNVKLIITNTSGEQATITQDNYITVKPAPTANELILDFTGTPRSGVSPLTVKFNDLSTGFLEPVTYLWDFGDGGTSTEQNPLYTYNHQGSYRVTLNISQSVGDPASLAKTNYITVESPLIPVLLIPDFTGTPRSGVTPLTVRFNDTSTGPHDQWEWEFGDGNKSIEQKPLYTYYKSGSYNVKLIITNTSGEQATIAQDNYINVNPAPTANELILDFNGTPRSGVSPLPVQFYDLSTGFLEPVTYLWDFGEGGTSTERNPLYTYNQQGSFRVTLNISQSIGAPASLAKNNYIMITPVPLVLPVVDFFGTPTSGVAPLTVIFTDLSTNTPIAWNWSFGDDSPENATVQNPIHTYADPGTYTVSVNATNANGSDSQTREGYIKVSPAAIPHVLPTADFFGIPTSGVAPLTVTFSDLSTETPTKWNWSFGDDSSENATKQNPVHTYDNPGNYTVLMNASNADGSDTQTRDKYITVNPAVFPPALPVAAPPVANFLGDPTSGVAPLTVKFSDLSTETPTSWNWSFGDDSLENATVRNPVHTYANPGTFTVFLNATNADGSDTKVWTDYITVSAVPLTPLIPEPLIPHFTGTPTSGPAPLTVQFNDTSTGPHNQWVWEFGDGNRSAEHNPLYTYNQPGSFNVTLNISQASGEPATITHLDYITVVTPLIPVPLNPTLLIPNFTGTPLSGPAPLTVKFDDTSTGPHDQWVWEFGDGNTSSTQKPLYTYNQPGSFNVTLNISQGGGEQVTITQHDYITVSAGLLEPPIADFSGKPTSGVAPLTVTFTDVSTNTPTSWNWSFGDESLENATVQNPVHTYTSIGNYTVTLNATNAAGLNITTKTNYINVAATQGAPVAEFSGTPTSGFAPLTVQFNDTSSGFVNPVTYLWDFGDGSTSTERNPSHTYTASTPENLTVTFNVSGNYGKTDTIKKSEYINLEIPTIELTLSESPPDPSLLSNGSIPLDQSSPQSKSGFQAQSLPQSKSGFQAQSLLQSKSGFQDQSLPQDISTQKDLSAASGMIIFPGPGQGVWSLNRGENPSINAFGMLILSNTNWSVKVWDAMDNVKTPGTEGKMALCNYITSRYEGGSLLYPLRVQSGSGDKVELSGARKEIQKWEQSIEAQWRFFWYPISLYQKVDSSDPASSQNSRYRIVITFEATDIS
jgi:PKD repeat protein